MFHSFSAPHDTIKKQDLQVEAFFDIISYIFLCFLRRRWGCICGCFLRCPIRRRPKTECFCAIFCASVPFLPTLPVQSSSGAAAFLRMESYGLSEEMVKTVIDAVICSVEEVLA